MALKKSQLYSSLWQSCDELRGGMDTSTALPSLSGREIGAICVPLPPLDEQRTIATVLSDMDAEIAAVERRHEKVREIKQD